MARRTDNKPKTNQNASNTIKDPDEWTTGEEPMTGAQESYLRTLASEAGEDVESNLTKAEASKRIDELQEKTGRGKPGRS
jgi:Protein of unknown function (DUF3072)